jgi:enolase
MATTIQNITSRQILDSRGYPTIEADILLSDGSIGRACVPSGASTGDKEALEMRDGNKEWCGKGVQKALNNIQKHIKPALLGKSPFNISQIDQIMIDLDGTDNKTYLGANAILAVSLANVRSGAISRKESLFEYIRSSIYPSKNLYPMIMPMPMMNILNGGSHADNNVDIQEFMIIPKEFLTYKDALRSGVEIFHSLKSILKSKNFNTAIGDEGGFAPNLLNNEQALELILEAIEKAGYKSGKEIMLSLDVAASELYDKKTKEYVFQSERKRLTAFQLIEYYKELCQKYPIISIEDGLDQNDWKHWTALNHILGDKVQIVGDDLTVTNPKLLKDAIDTKAINAILIKLNQIGTFSETIESINMAKKNDLGVIISHRSGETEDTFISDLSVAVNAGQIKTGSLCRADRTSKYNQLLRIEERLQLNAKYNSK